MTENPNTTPALLIDIRQLAQMLNRSVGSLERDQTFGRLPKPVRIGGSRQWRRAEIEAWVLAGCPHQAAWEAATDKSSGEGCFHE